MKSFNRVETIAILVVNQLSSHLKMKSAPNNSLTNHMYYMCENE